MTAENHRERAIRIAAQQLRGYVAPQLAESVARDVIEAYQLIMSGFDFGERVRKISSSEWNGRVCGYYVTDQTSCGACVESEREVGSVQIYPARALEIAPEDTA